MWNAFISLMINVLLYIYEFIGHDFGLAIIIFTILVRLLTYPLTASQMKSSKGMQELQKSKKWKDIQEKYKDDKETLAQKQMEIYKEMGINPLGSCLPTLIQFPIIIGLYQAVIRTLAVTPLQLIKLSQHISDGSSLIPINNHFLWMDLSEPERLTIFGVGIPLLAIIVAVTSFFQTKLISTTNPSTGGDDQAAQMGKAMQYYMPLLMGYFAYNYAAGLAVYFVASNLTSILQYALMGRIDFKELLPSKS
ncbi:MAG: Membrane protein insertase MisCA [Chloroflexi bacterium]|nr:Membrane protein insertase MisCA [Chloroflexota bacterium]